MADITRDDLRELKEDVLEQIVGGFSGINRRLDDLNGRTRIAETKIAIMEDRGQRDPTARWGAGLGVMAVVVGEWIMHKLGAKP
jgi:hypothetical protein